MDQHVQQRIREVIVQLVVRQVQLLQRGCALPQQHLDERNHAALGQQVVYPSRPAPAPTRHVDRHQTGELVLLQEHRELLHVLVVEAAVYASGPLVYATGEADVVDGVQAVQLRRRDHLLQHAHDRVVRRLYV